MKQKHIDKVLEEGYFIEVDVSNKKMNKLLKKLFPKDACSFDLFPYEFICKSLTYESKWTGVNTRPEKPIIKASKFFKKKNIEVMHRDVIRTKYAQIRVERLSNGTNRITEL